MEGFYHIELPSIVPLYIKARLQAANSSASWIKVLVHCIVDSFIALFHQTLVFLKVP